MRSHVVRPLFALLLLFLTLDLGACRDDRGDSGGNGGTNGGNGGNAVIGTGGNGGDTGTATATAAGEWSLQIAADNACKPTANAAVALKLNGAAVNATPAAVWAGGGLPSDVANGYVLAAGAAATGTVTAPKTGNAGLLGGSTDAASTALVLGVAIVALGAVVGTRVYAGRQG